MGENQRICKRCLLKEMSEAEYFRNLYDYIERLDDDVKTTPEVYEQRLAICKQCDNLVNGMCRICGCYVELRAVIAVRSCPAVEQKWKAVSAK